MSADSQNLPPKKEISRSRWAKISLFAMDVDGILTNGTIIVDSVGGESKMFSVLDGLGLARLIRDGISVAWISGRNSVPTAARAKELKVTHLIQGRTDKLAVLQDLANQFGLLPEQVIYMGDDDIDAPAILWAGIGVSVSTGMPAALAAAEYVTTRAAGFGAVREICEHITQAKSLTSIT